MSSIGTRVQEQPWKKKKKKTEPTSNPSLPEDLVVSCLARVSRLYYPTLSLVSKSFRSLLVSPGLIKTRSLLHRRDSCLYVCLQYPSDLNPRWFTLCRKPGKTLHNYNTRRKKSGNVLAPFTFLNSPPVEWSNLIAVGYNIYAIPGGIKGAPCSNIPFLDCRTHTWLETPSMRLSNTTLVKKKMYLPGNYEDPESLKCTEVFNTKTQTWNPVSPEKEMVDFSKLEGMICLIHNLKGFALQTKEHTLECVGYDFVCIGRIRCKYDKQFRWTIFNGNFWREIKGLEGLPKFSRDCTVKLVNYGGRLVVFWDEYVPTSGCKEKRIWCAEISIKRRGNKETWGYVEWCDAVLTVPESYKFVYAVAATA